MAKKNATTTPKNADKKSAADAVANASSDAPHPLAGRSPSDAFTIADAIALGVIENPFSTPNA